MRLFINRDDNRIASVIVNLVFLLLFKSLYSKRMKDQEGSTNLGSLNLKIVLENVDMIGPPT
ncbi:hypothetical protein PbJCM13498_01740 [Prolixibacter bellariivorans]|uniref:Uncharacterized protein n=1 Tax=Prolixibacter bellariivorans TaxID=314319 RepID=A0A5M4AUV0_9BACT|nr:hypothetical protein PbJCM13498_01740 [Prolixibacter bellariivorans]